MEDKRYEEYFLMEKKVKVLSKIIKPISITLTILAGISYLLISLLVSGILMLPVFILESILKYKKNKLRQCKEAMLLEREQSTKEKENFDFFEAANREEDKSERDVCVHDAEKTLEKHLFLNIIVGAIFAGGALLWGLLIFFVPYFSIIIEDNCDFNLVKGAMIWSWGSEESVYQDLLMDIIRECTISKKIFTTFLFMDEDGFYTLSISLFFVMFMTVGLAVWLPVNYGYRKYKFAFDKEYRAAIFYRYQQYSVEENKFSGAWVVRIFLYSMLIILFLPTIEFLFVLPKYFDGLTDSIYYVVLALYLIFQVVYFSLTIVMSLMKNQKAAAWAFAKKQ